MLSCRMCLSHQQYFLRHVNLLVPFLVGDQKDTGFNSQAQEPDGFFGWFIATENTSLRLHRKGSCLEGKWVRVDQRRPHSPPLWHLYLSATKGRSQIRVRLMHLRQGRLVHLCHGRQQPPPGPEQSLTILPLPRPLMPLVPLISPYSANG